MKKSCTSFTKDSIQFLNRLSRQKKLDWLEQHQDEYQNLLVTPMRELMATVSKNLESKSFGYRFPKRGFAHVKTSWDSEKNKGLFRNWFHVSVSRDSKSRYDSLPNLYFHFADGDFYSAGGLYMPSADQTKHIRKWIDQDPSRLKKLLADRKFKKIYSKGLGTERMLKTKPRDYSVDHPDFKWLKLSAWYVWRPIPKKLVLSKNFSTVLTEDWTQVLRLNEILDHYTQTWPPGTSLDHVPMPAIRTEFDF